MRRYDRVDKKPKAQGGNGANKQKEEELKERQVP
jgi:hypothetical protein